MDELDHNLLMAWRRVYQMCKADPAQARRRYRRTLPGTVLSRPHRAWCVAVRASDTRIEPGWMARPGTGCESGARVGDHGGGGTGFTSGARGTASGAQQAHEVVLTGDDLQRLGGPVWLRYPGVALREAAGMLGRSEATVARWLPVRVGKTVADKQGVAQARGGGRRRWATYTDAQTGWGVRYEPCRAAGRKAGMEVPVVWHDGPIDPGGFEGRPPAKGWGTLWMSLARKIPSGFEQAVWREPWFQEYKGGPRFRRWYWRCPGLPDVGPKAADGIRGLGGADAGARPPLPKAALGCGRRVSKLYVPLPMWTLGRALGFGDGLTVAGRDEKWRPGADDHLAGRRWLACAACWRVRHSTYTNSTGWNELVSYMSGGLLYGREVEQPSNWQAQRRRAFVTRRRTKAMRKAIAGR